MAYYLLQIFSGFFKVYIEPNLRKAEDIFYMIGYEVQKDSSGRVLDTLALQKPINRRTLTFIASECYFAGVECMIMALIMEKTALRYSIQDVYRSRVSCTGGIVTCVRWLTENCVPNSTINGSLRSAREEDEENEWTKIERKRQSRSLDDLLGRKTVQGAKMAELRRGDSDDTTRTRHPLSQEVKEWAESNLTDLYNGDESPSVSILRPKTEPRGPSRDSGYGSHYIPDSDIHSLPGQLDEALQAEDLYAGKPSTQINSVEQVEEFDMFKPRTTDDHVQRSLKHMEKVESPKKGRPQSSPGCADDWTHIRESLRKEYGDEYFEGERGCILKQNQAMARKSMPPELYHSASLDSSVTTKQPPPVLPKPKSKSRPAPSEPRMSPQTSLDLESARQINAKVPSEARLVNNVKGDPIRVTVSPQASLAKPLEPKVMLSSNAKVPSEPTRVPVSQCSVNNVNSTKVEPVRPPPPQLSPAVRGTCDLVRGPTQGVKIPSEARSPQSNSVSSGKVPSEPQSNFAKVPGVSPQSSLAKPVEQNRVGPQASFVKAPGEPNRVSPQSSVGYGKPGEPRVSPQSSVNYVKPGEQNRVSPQAVSYAKSTEQLRVSPQSSVSFAKPGEASRVVPQASVSYAKAGEPTRVTVCPGMGMIPGESRVAPQPPMMMKVQPRGPSPTSAGNLAGQAARQGARKPDLIEEDLPLPPPPLSLANDIMGHHGYLSDSDSDGFGEMGSKTIPPCRRGHHSHDPFIENCNRPNTNTIVRGRPSSAILEDQFKSILLAKEDRASSYYNTPTFSTFGKQHEDGEDLEWPAPPDDLLACGSTPGGVAATGPTWQCGACTFANQPGNSVCEMCGRSRVQEQQVSLDGPPCPKCTYVNHSGASHCGVCNLALNDSQA